MEGKKSQKTDTFLAKAMGYKVMFLLRWVRERSRIANQGYFHDFKVYESESVSHSVMSNSLQPIGL